MVYKLSKSYRPFFYYMGTFNIRVYGIFINSQNQLLVTDEMALDVKMTKFPGGGLEYGEGLSDCLRREIREEMNCEIEKPQHFYTTDYFQPALFFENTQLISVYYLISLPDLSHLPFVTQPFENISKNGDIVFRWINLCDLSAAEQLTFPIDQLVGEKLCKKTTYCIE